MALDMLRKDETQWQRKVLVQKDSAVAFYIPCLFLGFFVVETEEVWRKIKVSYQLDELYQSE